MKRPMHWMAMLATLTALSSAVAAVPDAGEFGKYYNQHLRLVHGIRSGQVLDDEDRAAGQRVVPAIEVETAVRRQGTFSDALAGEPGQNPVSWRGHRDFGQDVDRRSDGGAARHE